MAGTEGEAQEMTMQNTKKEMLAAYEDLLKRLEGEREAQMKPEEKKTEREAKKATEVADSLSMEGIAKEIGNLKAEVGGMLAQLSDRLEEAVGKYVQTKQAVETREKELQEIYEIEKAASSLTALLEAQKERREQFDAEMAEKKEDLRYEIETTREEWKEEQQAHQAEIKEREAAEKKARDREAEEHKYSSEREKRLAQEEFDYEKAKLDREMQLKREEMERDLSEREKAVTLREAELNELRAKMDGFPNELDAAVKKAVQETAERLNQETQTREELIKKQAEGEQNVLNSRIEALQQTVKEQAEHIARLAAQIDRSYNQVQDIAVKAIEGSANVQALAGLRQQVAAEQARRPAKDEG